MSDSALRRKAHKVGMQLTKLREGSRWYDQYGPYFLSVNGVIAHHSLDAEGVAEVLGEVRHFEELLELVR